jgi:hypothetical protein
MRARTLLAAVLALVVAGCGEAAPPGSGSAAKPGQNVGSDPDGSVSSGPLRRSPAKPQNPARCKRLAERLEGLDLATAETRTRNAGCALRVVERDGQGLAVTDDFSLSRINVHVQAGTITKVAGLF